MADKEEKEENTSRGNDWEVVSLTASAYAASPGPRELKLKDGEKGDNTHNEAETSHALFMSRHFVFPPNEHENLTSGPIEIHDDDKVSKEGESDFGGEREGKSHGKDEEDLTLKGLNLPDEFSGVQFLDEKGKKEESIFSTAAFSSLHDETVIGGSTVYEDKEPISEPIEPGLDDFGTDISVKDENHTETNVPCEAWWRRSAASLYAQAKEANTFWSVFIAAAVMGLVILGQHWQQERWQVLQLKWQSSLGNEKGGRISGPIFRLKDVLVGGQRRGSFIRTSSSTDN